ncbi:hypothetical protein BaRGS_00004407, partial [Batillaria attramentaria]
AVDSSIPSVHGLSFAYRYVRFSTDAGHRQAVVYIFDLLDFYVWKDKPDGWTWLSDYLQRLLLRDESTPTKASLQQVEQCWSIRKDWWPSYHFNPLSLSAKSSESQDQLVAKCIVASVFLGAGKCDVTLVAMLGFFFYNFKGYLQNILSNEFNVTAFCALQCFSCGVESGPHKRDHKYRFGLTATYLQKFSCTSHSLLKWSPSSTGFAFYLCPHNRAVGPSAFETAAPWCLAEENMLLDAVEQYGFGNWGDVSGHVETRTATECEEHYVKYYIQGNIGKATFPSEFGSRVTDHTCPHGEPLSPSITTPLPPMELSLQEQQELGYMPLRDDFEREYDNEAETLISGLSIVNDDDELDLNIEEYDEAKYKREKRKENRKKMNSSSTPKRNSTVSKKAEGKVEKLDILIDDDDTKDDEEDDVEDSKEMACMPGYEMLSEREKKLCNSIKMIPATYITIKTCIIKDYLQRRQGVPVKIRFPSGMDKTHRRKIMSFLSDNGWIG